MLNAKLKEFILKKWENKGIGLIKISNSNSF
jgi:hypothetical protein